MTTQIGAERKCGSTYYTQNPCSGLPDYDVIYTASSGVEAARHSACLEHGHAEARRHRLAGGIAAVRVDRVVDVPSGERPFASYYDEAGEPLHVTNRSALTTVQIATVLHYETGTLTDVSFHPRGCSTCERAVELYETWNGMR